MEIYIESRGFSQDDDYRWLKVTEQSQTRIDKEDLPGIIQKANQLIDTESESVVLARNNNKLLLLITGIKAVGRVDFADRQIRIAAAWLIADCLDNEIVLRMLATTALNPESRQYLAAEMSQAVSFGGETGFQVNFEHIHRLTDVNKAKNSVQNNLPSTSKKIAKLSPKRQVELVSELLQYRLPTQKGLIVVVTGIKKAETLINAGIWRGLSSLVISEDWQIIPHNLSENNQSNKFSNYFNRLMIILGIIGTVSLLVKTCNF
ncbi:MAG: hypothetical protein QNJ68_00350 [Microcoleaceae cyanobacterium MO_207.B10]|nr:hypothetical protein [Microcoleaceae cyanobacterium MO_207.B10]